MDCFRIEGPVSLSGSVAAAGSKNAALPILAASLLAQGPVELHRIPRLGRRAGDAARAWPAWGPKSTDSATAVVGIAVADEGPFIVPTRLARAMRASFCVLGPLLARRGRAVVPLPGGCRIGPRPIDLHLAGLAALGSRSVDRRRSGRRPGRTPARRDDQPGRPPRLDRHRHRQRPFGRRAGPRAKRSSSALPASRRLSIWADSSNRSAPESKDSAPT